MNIINENNIFYHSSIIDNLKLNNNRHIWLSEKLNYSRNTNKFFKPLYKCISYIIDTPIGSPSETDSIYIIKNKKKLNLIEVESEYVMNMFYMKIKYFYRYCNIKNIDGIYSKNGFYEYPVYLLYIKKEEDYIISKLPKDYYPENNIYYIKKNNISFINTINFFFIYISIFLCYFLNLKDKYNKYLYNDMIDTNNIFLKNNKYMYLKEFQKKRYNINNYLNLPKSKKLRICTYNLFSYKFPTVDGFEDTINDTLYFINNINPDILCLQESYSLTGNLNKISSNCNYSYNYSKWNTSILSKHKSIYRSYRIPYSNIFDLYRYMVVGYLKDYNIWIYNIHLDPFDKSGNTRKKQINYILTKIKKISNFKRSILLGDFNTLNLKDYSDDKLDYMNKYENDFLSNNDFGDIPKYFIDSLSKHNIINPETSIYKKRVDYIFISKDLSFDNSYILQYTTSDHFPVIIDL